MRLEPPGHGGVLRRRAPWLGLILLAIVLDQASKAAVVSRLALGETRLLFPTLSLTRSENTGVSFSQLQLQSGLQRWPLVALNVAVATALIVRFVSSRQVRPLAAASSALIVGGALGNALDRVRLGYVVDFVHFHIGGWSFAVFNLADAAITTGVALLLLDGILRPAGPKSHAPIG